MTHIIVDVVLLGVFLIALIVGLVKGFAKQVTGLLKGFVSFILSVVLTAVVINILRGSSLLDSLANTATGWFGAEIFTTSVSSAEELQTLLSNAQGIWAFLGGISDKLYAAMSGVGVSSVGALFGYYISLAISAIVVWILLLIIIKVIFSLIGKVLTKIAHLPVLSTIDRLMGAVWALAITYFFVVGILLSGIEIVLANYWTTYATTVTDIIQQTKILNLLHQTNFIGNLISQSLSISLLTTAA